MKLAFENNSLVELMLQVMPTRKLSCNAIPVEVSMFFEWPQDDDRRTLGNRLLAASVDSSEILEEFLVDPVHQVIQKGWLHVRSSASIPLEQL